MNISIETYTTVVFASVIAMFIENTHKLNKLNSFVQ